MRSVKKNTPTRTYLNFFNTCDEIHFLISFWWLKVYRIKKNTNKLCNFNSIFVNSRTISCGMLHGSFEMWDIIFCHYRNLKQAVMCDVKVVANFCARLYFITFSALSRHVIYFCTTIGFMVIKVYHIFDLPVVPLRLL